MPAASRWRRRRLEETLGKILTAALARRRRHAAAVLAGRMQETVLKEDVINKVKFYNS